MAEVIMPRLSDTMEEGELAKWLKNVGDKVAKGDVLAEIETDKATMDLEAFESGILEQQLVAAGTVVPIGTPVAIIGDGSGTSAKPTPVTTAPAKAPSTEVKEPNKSPESSASVLAEVKPATGTPIVSGDLRTSPLARKIAKEHGIDLATLNGSGPGGRIVRADVDAAIANPSSHTAAASQTPASQVPTQILSTLEGERVAPGKIRVVAAKRLTVSQAVPHFFLTSVADVEKLLEFRGDV
ncbi:MAG: E3 binding domain-containing protein, partial [Cryobacterium sp.]|nr:E3 binding domain-containing protein [Cryobacterium sp.]